MSRFIWHEIDTNLDKETRIKQMIVTRDETSENHGVRFIAGLIAKKLIISQGTLLVLG